MAWGRTSVPLMPMASFKHFCNLFYCVTNDFTAFICLFHPGRLCSSHRGCLLSQLRFWL
jgi:hypothetical protein